MKTKHPSERGQVLIIVVFVMVGLMGITGLAIDGSRAYSDRRHAQNAADTAALAAALAYVRTPGEDWMSVAYSRAASNGYDDNETTNFVDVYYPPVEGPYTGNTDYVQVIITSHLGTLFGKVIGIEQVTNTVQAIARVTPGINQSMYNGNALVALNKTACSALSYQGAASLTVKGSGIFSNSKCTSSSNGAFDTSTGSGVVTVPCLTAVGTITTGTNTNLNTSGCKKQQDPSLQIQDPYSVFQYPNITCGSTNAKIQPDGFTMSPGNYSGAFPPTGVTTLQSGIYCLDTTNHGFTVNTNGQQLVGSGVVIYMKSGKVTWNSGDIHLSAPTDGPYTGLLLYLPPKNPANCEQITINGNGSSTFDGSILAPCSNVKLTGGAGGDGYNNQIIADTIYLSGNTNITINFDSSKQWQPLTSPSIELVR